ncbi:hypothetical protein L2E82_22733 [Cichorium intybus]|uniref:Uncharacterized protein n=1 Tax=Cichorium intybus TaxID=13427 RepID=A0ACB9DYK0_CICIN|nr:hypothetical protein L2E82_22733 [Cichorium intybus]
MLPPYSSLFRLQPESLNMSIDVWFNTINRICRSMFQGNGQDCVYINFEEAFKDTKDKWSELCGVEESKPQTIPKTNGLSYVDVKPVKEERLRNSGPENLFMIILQEINDLMARLMECNAFKGDVKSVKEDRLRNSGPTKISTNYEVENELRNAVVQRTYCKDDAKFPSVRTARVDVFDVKPVKEERLINSGPTKISTNYEVENELGNAVVQRTYCKDDAKFPSVRTYCKGYVF